MGKLVLSFEWRLNNFTQGVLQNSGPTMFSQQKLLYIQAMDDVGNVGPLATTRLTVVVVIKIKSDDNGNEEEDETVATNENDTMENNSTENDSTENGNESV